MKRIHLSDEEKTDLESLHYSSNDGKQRDRIKAVQLSSEGWTVPMISQALRIHNIGSSIGFLSQKSLKSGRIIVKIIV